MGVKVNLLIQSKSACKQKRHQFNINVRLKFRNLKNSILSTIIQARVSKTGEIFNFTVIFQSENSPTHKFWLLNMKKDTLRITLFKDKQVKNKKVHGVVQRMIKMVLHHLRSTSFLLWNKDVTNSSFEMLDINNSGKNRV